MCATTDGKGFCCLIAIRNFRPSRWFKVTGSIDWLLNDVLRGRNRRRPMF